MISTKILISERDNNYVRPDYLSEGKNYLLLERQSYGDRLVQETVQFVSYTACPATVIVLDSKNHRFCIPRDRLFIATPMSDDVNPITRPA